MRGDTERCRFCAILVQLSLGCAACFGKTYIVGRHLLELSQVNATELLGASANRQLRSRQPSRAQLQHSCTPSSCTDFAPDSSGVDGSRLTSGDSTNALPVTNAVIRVAILSFPPSRRARRRATCQIKRTCDLFPEVFPIRSVSPARQRKLPYSTSSEFVH